MHRLRHEDVGFVDRAPIQVLARRTVDASVAQIWPLVADAAAWPSWFDGMSEAGYTTAEPHGVGSQRQVTVKGLRVTEDIVTYDEPHCFAFVVIEANRPGLAAMVEVVTVQPSASGAEVTYRQAIELASWLRPMAPLVRRALTRAVTTSLDNLARHAGSTQ
jgi:uncharacterized protein YndB with AHSA1/START domain